MTTKTYQPTNFDLEGIFLLSRESLLELDPILDEIEREFAQYSNRKINHAVKKRFEERSKYESEVDKKQLKSDIKSRYPFNNRTREIELHCESKRKYTAKKFEDIFKSPGIEDEKPIYANIAIRNGEPELKVKLLGQYVANRIEISASPNRAFTVRAAHQFKDWAEENRRYDWYGRLALPLGSIGFGLLFVAIMLLPIGLFSTYSDKSFVIQQAREILRSGVSESETGQALETILKIQVGDFQTVTRPELKPWYVSLVFISIGLLVFGISCPKSTIGLGRNEKRLKRIEFYSSRLWIWVCAWVFAIASSALGSVLFDWIRRSAN